jgi:hypothetical protein
MIRSIQRTGGLVALVALGSLGSAQGKTGTAAAPARTTEASVEAEMGVPFKFAVTGLTKENLEKVKSALAALTTEAYVCDPCKVMTAEAGACSKCKAALVAAKKPLLLAVQTMPEEGALALMLDRRLRTRLSQIETTLGTNSVTIDRKKLRFATGPVLIVVRDGTADQVATLEKAVREAKLFEEAAVTFDAATKKLLIRARCGTEPPAVEQVTTFLGGHKLATDDIIFGRSTGA